MTEDRRIRDLESQVRRLQQELARARNMTPGPEPRPQERPPTQPPRAPMRPAAAADPAPNATPGPARDLLATTSGTGFNRGAVAFLMTVMAIGGALALSSGDGGAGPEPWHRVAAGYAVALGCVTLGWFSRERGHPLAHLLLGAGLAAFYVATYAACLAERLGPFVDLRLRWPVLMGVLALLLGAVHLRAARRAAGIAIIAVYGTAAHAATLQTHDGFAYALVVCTALAAISAVFLAAHGWRGQTWFALLATYGVFYYAFRSQPPELGWTPDAYRWGASVAITIGFAAFALACLVETRRAGSPSRLLTAAGLANVALYAFWMRRILPPEAPVWPLYAGVATATALLALAGETRGGRARYASLTQVYAACATVLLALALFDAIIPAKTLPALATLTFALVLVGGLTQMPVLRILALLGTVATFLLAAPEVSMPGRIRLWGLALPANWFSGMGVALLFCAGAWLATHLPKPGSAVAAWRGARITAWCTPRLQAFAMAGGAALLTLTLIVFDIGEDPVLPFVLTFGGIAMAGIGLVALTPAIELSSLAVLAGAHVTWHRFMDIDPYNFSRLAGFDVYSALLGIATAFAALLWERRLDAADARKPFDHYAMTALPWLIVTALGVRLAGHWFTEGYAPIALSIFGAGLVAAGFAVRSVGAVTASSAAFACAAASLASALQRNPGFLPQGIGIAGYALAILAPFSVAERLLYVFAHRRISRHGLDDLYRSALVAAAGTLGLLLLHIWSQSAWTLAWWGLHALVGAGLGLLFAETRYHWAAAFVVAMIGLRFALYDLGALPLPVRLLATFVALAAAIALAWRVARQRPERPHAHARG